MEHRVRVWNTKVTTVEQPGKNGHVSCEGCEAPCCKGMFLPLLTAEECFSGRYPLKFIDIPELKKDVPNAGNVACLAMSETGCFFHKGNRCTIWGKHPRSCQVYDCRNDERMREFVAKRFG